MGKAYFDIYYCYWFWFDILCCFEIYSPWCCLDLLTDAILCRVIGALLILFNILITYEDVYMLYQYNFCKGCYWYAMEYKSICIFESL